MSQNDMVIANQTFPATRTDINAALQALASTSGGSSRPSTAYAGQLWIDTNSPASDLWTFYMYDGTNDVGIALIDTTNHLFIPIINPYAGTVGGTANAITLSIAPAPAPAAYYEGVTYVFKAASNNTGAVTVDLDSLGVKNVTKFGTTPLVAGDIVSGMICVINYDGTRFQLQNPATAATPVSSRSSNTILSASDSNKLFVATSSFTQTLDAAATLGNGWSTNYRNNGTGLITLDPNGAETIDGSTNLVLYPQEAAIIFCDGSALYTIGRTKSYPTAYVVSDFSVTSNTTLADVTGLTVTLAAGKAYLFEANLFHTAGAAGGIKTAIGGTTTLGGTAFTFDTTVLSNAAAVVETRTSNLNTAGGAVTGPTVSMTRIIGRLVGTNAGTLTVQFAQNASSGTASVVLAGSMFRVSEL